MDFIDPDSQAQGQPSTTDNSNQFLDNYKSFIGKSEGADYNTIVGGKTFDDFSKHPGVVGLTTSEGPSTAAGRYQITKTTYDKYASKLNINDFSKESQDKIAEAIFKDKGAWDDINKGDYESANKKLGGVWASLPTSKYNQPKRSEEWAKDALFMDPDKAQTPTKEEAKPAETTGFIDPDTTSAGGFIDPDAVKETKPGRTPGAAETFAEHTIFGVPVSAAGYAGMTAGAAIGEDIGLALAPVTMGASTVVMPLVGGAIGMFGSGYMADKALRSVGPESLNQLLDKGAQEHPYAAFTGDLASYIPVGGIGLPKTITLPSGKEVSAAKQVAVLVTGGSGLEAGREYATGEKFDPVKIGITALATPLMAGEPTAIGKAVTFEKMRNLQPTELLEDLQAKLHDTIYEDRLNEHMKQQRDFQSFEEFKKGQQAQGDLFEDPSLKKTDEQLKQEYEHTIKTRAVEEFLASNPEANRPNVNTPNIPKDDEGMRNYFYNLIGAKTQDKIIADHILNYATKDNLTAEMRDNIRKHIETGSSLTAQEEVYYNKYFKDSLTSLKANTRYLMDKGIIPKEEITDNFFSRMFEQPNAETIKRLQEQGIWEEEPSMWQKIRDAFVAKDFGSQDIESVKSSGKQRAIFEFERNGKKSIVQVGKNGKLFEWTNGKARPIYDDITKLTADGTLKAGDEILGGKLAQGSMEDIEQHTPYRYNRDSLAVLMHKLNETREMVRGHQSIENLKESDYFKDGSHVIERGVEMPEGYQKPKYTDRVPALNGYAFPARTAWIIEDFARQRNPNLLTDFSGLLVKNMMLNPLPHIFNEAWHLYNARGLSGWVTPGGIARFVKGMPEALKHVLNQDEFYRDSLKYNGSLLAPSTRASAAEEAIGRKSLNEFAQGGGLKELASYFGRTVADMYDGISKASNKAMWIVRDTMYIQYVKEIMDHKGLSHEMAIKEAERHLPSYRLPETIGEGIVGARAGRVISEALQNPNISVFSRYHYGMVKSIIETMKDLGAIRKGPAGMAKFKEGVDTMAAIALATAALYPLMDMMAQRLTGNPEAKQRRAGPYHLGHAISEVADGTKDPQAVLSAIFTFNPMLLALAQLGFDRQLYNGQPIYNPQSSPDVIAHDVGKYAIQQVPQPGQFMKAYNDKSGEGFQSWGARQADIESPTSSTTHRLHKMLHRLKEAARSHNIKTRREMDK